MSFICALHLPDATTAKRPAGQALLFVIVAALYGLLASSRLPAAESPTLQPAEPSLTLSRAEVLVSGASHGRARAIAVFPGRHGMIGVVVSIRSKPDHKSIVWVTPDEQALLVGELVDAHGADLNVGAAIDQRLHASPKRTLATAVMPASRSLLTPGKGPVLTFFLDPNCIFCHKLYEAIMPRVAKDELRVRFIMVGIIKRDSPQRAAAILSATDPLKALEEDETHFDPTVEEGGFPIAGIIPSVAAVKAVSVNNHLMARAGAQGTPTLLYCSKSAGGGVRMQSGVPTNLDALIGDLVTGPVPGCH